MCSFMENIARYRAQKNTVKTNFCKHACTHTHRYTHTHTQQSQYNSLKRLDFKDKHSRNPFTAPGCHMTTLAKCFPSTHRMLCDFLIDYIKISLILTPYKLPQRLSLICSDFSGDRSWEETASVIQFVGRERVHKLTTSLTCNHAREGHPHGQQKLLVRTPQNLCRDKIMFVATKYLSRHAYFSHDKRPVLSRQTHV